MIKVGVSGISPSTKPDSSTDTTKTTTLETLSFDNDVEAVRYLYSQVQEDNIGRILLEGIVYNIVRWNFSISMEASKFTREFAGGLGYLIGGHFKYNGNKECRLIDTAIRNYIEYRIDKEHFKENKSTGRYPQDELLEVVNSIIR
ncbi:MAG: hypothetical protein J6Y02_23435 [Pseudobutyrivibrio sp.]|nr:hypothetical protein [Pseudobutyrivibrio sp.]